MLGNFDLVKPEGLDHADEDLRAGKDRRRAVRVEPGNFASLSFGHRRHPCRDLAAALQ